MTAAATTEAAVPAPAAAPIAVQNERAAIVSAERAHFDNTYRWGRLMAESRFFKDATEAAQAAVKIQAGHELGLQPGAAMRGIFVFDGKISLSAGLMAAKVNESPHYEFDVVQTDAQKCIIKWHGMSKRTRAWRELGTSSFTIEEAQSAGLTSKDNWKKYPKSMLYARALSAGCRTYCPELFNGAVYVPEEVGTTITVDVDGNVTNYEPTPNNAPPAQNVTPINAAPSARGAASATGSSRDELLAAARAANGIEGKSMTAAQMQSLLVAVAASTGKTYKALRDVSDDDLRAYLGASAQTIDAEPEPTVEPPAETVDYCTTCGAQTSPKADAEPHETGCDQA